MIPSRVRHSCIIRVEAVFIEGMSACVVSARIVGHEPRRCSCPHNGRVACGLVVLRVRQVCANPLV